MSRQPADEEETVLVAGVDVQRGGFDWALLKAWPKFEVPDLGQIESVRSDWPEMAEVAPLYLSEDFRGGQ